MHMQNQLPIPLQHKQTQNKVPENPSTIVLAKPFLTRVDLDHANPDNSHRSNLTTIPPILRRDTYNHRGGPDGPLFRGGAGSNSRRLLLPDTVRGEPYCMEGGGG